MFIFQNTSPRKPSRGMGVQVLDSACSTLEGNKIWVQKSCAIRCMGKSRGRIHKNVLKSWERKHALVIGDLASICRFGRTGKGVNKKDDLAQFFGEGKQAVKCI